MDLNQASEILNLFNEKVKKLLESGLTKYVCENGLKVSMKSSIDNPVDITDNFPDQEAIDAFVLTIRFFIQNNESISLHNLAKLYKKLPCSQEIKDDFNRVRDKLNQELDKKSIISWRGTNLTYRDIINTVIYGGLAHANQGKKQLYDSWMKEKLIRKFIELEFNEALFYFLNCIVYISKINLKALEELGV